MRHQKQRHKLSRDSAHRKALLMNLSKEVIQHERIKTTEAKAKAAKPEIEKLITLAKRGGLSNRRLAQSRLMDDAQLAKLFDVLASRYADRNGGYTRIIKAGIRASDAAPIAVIEFVDRDVSAKGQDSGPVMTEEEFEAA
jgi:large subunit ribosomal protein L17